MKTDQSDEPPAVKLQQTSYTHSTKPYTNFAVQDMDIRSEIQLRRPNHSVPSTQQHQNGALPKRKENSEWDAMYYNDTRKDNFS